MSVQGAMNGTRLSYVVVPQEGTVTRTIHTWHKTKGLQTKNVEEPAGYLVYFPRGHVIRIRSKEELRHYRLHKEPNLINLQGLSDPNSPLGRMMLAQDEAGRRAGMQKLEEQVIKLAEAHSGKIVLVRDVADLETEEAA